MIGLRDQILCKSTYSSKAISCLSLLRNIKIPSVVTRNKKPVVIQLIHNTISILTHVYCGCIAAEMIILKWLQYKMFEAFTLIDITGRFFTVFSTFVSSGTICYIRNKLKKLRLHCYGVDDKCGIKKFLRSM